MLVSKEPLPKGSITFSDSTNKGDKMFEYKPMGNISHSDHHNAQPREPGTLQNDISAP